MLLVERAKEWHEWGGSCARHLSYLNAYKSNVNPCLANVIRDKDAVYEERARQAVVPSTKDKTYLRESVLVPTKECSIEQQP